MVANDAPLSKGKMHKSVSCPLDSAYLIAGSLNAHRARDFPSLEDASPILPFIPPRSPGNPDINRNALELLSWLESHVQMVTFFLVHLFGQGLK